jgi:lipopolysaccharide transport system ATP-binding protein
MSQIAIRVENLSKKYILRHLQSGRYRTLRESIMNRTRSVFRRATGNGNEASDEHEEFWALKDVSFEIPVGEVVGVIGRNGAGKSTLLKLLSRITEPTSGRISINGRVASLLEVGTGFHPELTGRENIFLNGAVLGMGRDEIRRKFDEIVAFAETEKFLDTPVKHYSSGMYVRLAFAVAAHLEPEILIIDEVLAVGDARFQQKCIGRMRDVSASGRTVLFVSHNMTAVSSLCSRGMLLAGGVATELMPVENAINLYMRDQTDLQTGERWTGSAGDSQVKLLALSVESEGNDVLTTDRLIKVRLTLSVLAPVSSLIVAINLLSGIAQLAFSAQYDSEEANLPTDFSPGEYQFEIQIPANTLAQGRYSIVPDIGIYNRRRIVGDSVCLDFYVNNLTGLGRRFLAGKALENMFRPNWAWSQS